MSDGEMVPRETDLTPRPNKSVVEQHKWKYRIGYPLIKILILCLVFEIPATRLFSKKEGLIRADALSEIVFFSLMALILFYTLQGSNPGYLTRENTLTPQNPMQSLLLIENDVNIEAERIEAIRHQKDRIQMIENELAILESQKESMSNQATNDRDLSDDSLSAESTHGNGCIYCDLSPAPLRSHHCRYCEKCVATYDHHCFCIGTCIGERNHCRFWWFLLFQSFELILALSVVISGFHSNSSIMGWIRQNSLALTTSTIIGILAIFIIPLFLFHTFLIMSNLTTYEVGKGPEELWYLRGTNECDLPFSNGTLENMSQVCCVQDGFWTSIVAEDWKPKPWKHPGRIDRDSENIIDHLWENKYYSCC